MTDLTALSALLDVQPEPVGLLSRRGVVMVANQAFADGVDMSDAALVLAVRDALRASGTRPLRVRMKDGTFRRGLLTPVAIGAERLAQLRLRQGRSEFRRLSQGLSRLNAKLSLRSRSEMTLRQVLDAAVEGVIVCDADGLVLETNASVDRLVGTVVRLDDLIPDRAWRAMVVDQTAPTSAPVHLSARGPDGEDLTLEVTIGRSRSVDGVLHVVVIHDRTDRARLERARRDVAAADTKARLAATRDQAKTRFLSMTSHELRTPLHGVISALDLMEAHGIDDPELRALFKIALRASEAALDQVNRVLEITRFETRVGTGLVEDPFEPAEVIASVIEQQSAFAAKRRNILTFAEPVQRHATVLGDAYLFRQIVQNLVGNALKFTSDGTVNVRLDLTGLEDGRTRLDMTVADSGVGFDISQKERLLREFETAHSRHARIEDGAGIGLSLVSRAVNRMQGVLDISSIPGRGSAFRVIIDLAPGTMAQPAPDAAGARTGQFGLSVLVVDDGEINRDVLGKMLAGMGCRVTLAVDGQSALRELAQRPFDLVFMDISMPDMDGREVTTRYLSGRPEAAATIVGLTAHSDDETRRSCIAAGMQAVLVKPLRRAHLHAFLAELHPEGAGQGDTGGRAMRGAGPDICRADPGSTTRSETGEPARSDEQNGEI